MEVKPFIALMKRCVKSKFKTFLLHEHMIMQCYSIDIDSDIGMHYILHIPHSEAYSDDFYNLDMIIRPDQIMETYKRGHDTLTQLRKEKKLKPKDAVELMEYKITDTELVIKFRFLLEDEVVATESYSIEYPLNQVDTNVENIISTYDSMLKRIKVGGYSFAIDGIRYGLYNRILDSADVVNYKATMNGVKIQVPLCKSMLLGTTGHDEFFISVVETNISNVYIFTIQLAKNNIIDQQIGYLMAF